MTDQQFPRPGDPTAIQPVQPVQPVVPQPVVQQPGQPFGTPAAAGGRRTGLIVAGALVLTAGVAGGVVMLSASSSSYDEGVQNLARAPIGCTTSLEFDEAGTYIIYVETTGSVDDLRGDCPNADNNYDTDPEDLPDVDIVLVDDNGDEVDLDTDSSADYDAAGFVGRSVASVEIAEAGDFELTATSDEDEIVVAVGRNPQDAAATMRTTGIVVLALGAAFGGLLVVLGTRQRKATPSLAPAQQQPFPPGQFSPGQFSPGQFSPAPPAAPAGFPPGATGPLTPPTPPTSTPPAPPAPPAGPPPDSWPAPPLR